MAAAISAAGGSTTAARANCHVTAAIRPSDAATTPSRQPPSARDARSRGISGCVTATKDEAGCEDGRRGQCRAGPAAEQVADERGGGEDRAGRDLSDGDGVDELLVAQPAPAFDQVRAQEREQDVTAAEQDGAHLQEEERQPGEGEGHRDSHTGRSGGGRCRGRGRSVQDASEHRRGRREPGADRRAAPRPVRRDCQRQPDRAARCEQGQLVDAADRRRQRAGGDRRVRPAAERRLAQLHERLRDDGDDHGSDAVHQPSDLRSGSVPRVGPGHAHHDQRCRQDEAGARQGQSREAPAPIAEMDRQLGGVRTRDQVGCRDQIEEFLVRQPPAPVDPPRRASSRCARPGRRTR